MSRSAAAKSWASVAAGTSTVRSSPSGPATDCRSSAVVNAQPAGHAAGGGGSVPANAGGGGSGRGITTSSTPPSGVRVGRKASPHSARNTVSPVPADNPSTPDAAVRPAG